MKTERNEGESKSSSTELSKNEKKFSTNLNENEKCISTEHLFVDETYLMKYETLHRFNKFDFVWPGAIERLKVANIRKKCNDQIPESIHTKILLVHPAQTNIIASKFAKSALLECYFLN